jgi:quercetin dioxygenase-like cupin family protein
MGYLKSALIAVGCMLVMASVSIAQAQDYSGRKEIKRTDLTGAPGMEVITSFVEIKPGETIPRHSHHGVESVYVIQGGTLQQPGKAPREVPDGTTIMNLRDVVHGGDKNVGNKTFKMYTVHTVDKGKPLYEYVNK